MEKKLKLLFDFQLFQDNQRLASVIRKTEKEYLNELSDADLALVNAAGEIDETKRKKNIGSEHPDDD